MIKEFKKADGLYKAVIIFYLISLFSSFWRGYIVSFQVPFVGTMFPFRIYLAITFILYVIWIIRKKEKLFLNTSLLEKCIYGLVAILIIYSIVSLFRAIDFMWTFRKLFNLCIDLVFFILCLRLCKNDNVRKASVYVVTAGVVLLMLLGVYEVFNGAIFVPEKEKYFRFTFYKGLYHYPMVTFVNTNDYSMSLIFYFSVILLYAAENWRNVTKGVGIAIAISIGLVFFLLLAASARLVLVSFVILFIGFTAFLLLADRKRFWIILISLVLIIATLFLHEYRNLTGSEHKKASSLQEELFEINEETNELQFRSSRSGGSRALLLIHCFNCFVESKGLGVGLGNTEQLAEIRKVALNHQGEYYSAIHCFIGRLISDYGIFSLIPLCIIACLLFAKLFRGIRRSIREKSAFDSGYCFLLLAICLLYPIASTASSDAQDSLAMWYYLAFIFIVVQSKIKTEEKQLPTAQK